MWGFLYVAAIVVAVGTGIGAVIGASFMAIDRYRARYSLDTYNQPERVRLASFVCPECLRRSYAPEHIQARYCARCDKAFPLIGGAGSNTQEERA